MRYPDKKGIKSYRKNSPNIHIQISEQKNDAKHHHRCGDDLENIPKDIKWKNISIECNKVDHKGDYRTR